MPAPTRPPATTLRALVRRTLALGVGSVLPLIAARAQRTLLPSGTGFSLMGAVAITETTSRGSGLDGSNARMGAQLELAYGATPRLALVAKFQPLPSSTDTRNYTVRATQLGLRYLGKAGAGLRPFIAGGFAVHTMRYAAGGTFTSTNGGPWLDAGVMRLTSSHWSGEAALLWTQSTFNNWKQDGQAVVAEAAAWRALGLRAGLRYWVRAR